MSSDLQYPQRRLISGVAILVLLFLLLLGVILQLIQNGDQDRQIGHRSPASRLSYCVPGDNSRLCIVSFDQIVGGDMLISFQVPRLLYPEFALVINRYGVETTYACKRAKGLTIDVTCTGASQVPGEILQFKVFSRADDGLLAEGKFAIIGIALSTPEILLTETSTPSAVPEATGTTEIPLTPSPTSSPNPSYPNPTSYP
jgi:hypothetical protein